MLSCLASVPFIIHLITRSTIIVPDDEVTVSQATQVLAGGMTHVCSLEPPPLGKFRYVLCRDLSLPVRRRSMQANSTQQRAQFSMWAVMSAPLLMSSNVRNLSADAMATYRYMCTLKDIR